MFMLLRNHETVQQAGKSAKKKASATNGKWQMEKPSGLFRIGLRVFSESRWVRYCLDGPRLATVVRFETMILCSFLGLTPLTRPHSARAPAVRE
jgi:hypothetical protein